MSKERVSSEKSTSGSSSKRTITVKYRPKKQKRSGGKNTRGKSKSAKRRGYRSPGQRDPRLPKIGTTITKQYKGTVLNVRVLKNGFEYDGRVFRSLSAVARDITGAIWNGFLFFALTNRSKKK